ncbi:MAG: acylneuraminate cytidylyltransferase family protein [Methanotrichaceae archaeon]|nr:acylneuraminate cytidylyltransferase family protein [Methanotrichaceae archaeon]
MLLAGKPLISYTIKAALASTRLDRFIVSTDSPKIADIANSYGAEVPFLRPSNLAKDETPGIMPIIHAVKWLNEHENYDPDYILILQPTSPFRNSKDIDSALQLAMEKNAEAVVSVCLPRYHPYWMKKVDHEGKIENFLNLDGQVRRQDLPKIYALNGAIYLIKKDILLKQETLYPARTYAYIMPPERSLDIDTKWDLFLADLIMKYEMFSEI